MHEFGDPLIRLWKRENKKFLYHTPIFDLVSFDMTHPRTGNVKPYYVLETASWVNTIPLTESGEIVLVRQYRHGLNEYSLELPGGVVEDVGKEAILQSAMRELSEETGYTSSNWEYFSKVSGNPAIFNNWSYTYIARNCKKTTQTDFDEGEDIEVFLVELERIPSLIKDGTIHHSIMVSALARFFLEKYSN